MNFKKILLFMILALTLVLNVSGADFYDSYRLAFLDDKPNSLRALSYECQDTSCVNAISSNVEYFKGDAITCWTDFGIQGDSINFLSCMETYKIPSGASIDMNDCDILSDGCSGDPYIFAKYNTDVSFGYINYFYTSSDSYIPYKVRNLGFNCEFDICVNTAFTNVLFGKVGEAIAEIGQVNIVNIDNPNKPVQIEVPVSIEETVCSAFIFTDKNTFRPAPPAGYSDYSANTRVSLDITNANTGVSYLHQDIIIPIEADTCAGLAAFSWTPFTGLQDEEIKFRLETEVIDNQVISSLIDWAEVIETVYPENLDGSCWTRAHDFTLSNINSFDLTTSVAQINEGETLYALFRSGAFRDESITPMPYVASIKFDNVLIYQTILSSTSDNLDEHVIELTSNILGLGAGVYNVTLETTPFGGTTCINSASVTQTQNLNILEANTHDVNFYIRDSNLNFINNANINLVLLSADDNLINTPIYNQNIATNTQGIALFEDIISGNYKYTLTKSNFTSITNDIHIASDTEIYITMTNTNSAPVINLPEEFSSYYLDDLEFDIRNYVSDFNNDFADLSFAHEIISGTGSVFFNGIDYTIRTNLPNTLVLKITVTDPLGESASDTIRLNFLDNEEPRVVNFIAEPDNGAEPFTTNFLIQTSDDDNDALTCILDFGDGTQLANDDCDSLDGIEHTYINIGTYNTRLTVSDGISSPVTAFEQVFVFERLEGAPHINFFNLDSSNGFNLASNLTLTWDAIHTENLAMICTLRINGISSPVSCSNGIHTINNFDIVGESVFTLIASDGEFQELRTIRRSFIRDNNLPVIEVFDANPRTGILSLNTVFDIVVSDADNDALTCNLDFGDGSSVFNSCDNLISSSSLAHLYGPGIFTPTLTLSDGIDTVSKSLNIVVVIETKGIPQINSFDLTTADGDYILESNLTFTWDVIHTKNLPMICNLRVNGVDFPVNCNAGTYNINNFDIAGPSVFTLIADDGEFQDLDTITRTFIKNNNLPQINIFDANPKTGVGSINSLFNIAVSDLDGDTLSCALNFGDGSNYFDDCDNIISSSILFHTYGPGLYTPTLSVSDGIDTVFASLSINVVSIANGAPQINFFSLNTDDGDFVLASNLTFNWDVVHPLNLSMNCNLDINGNLNIIPCSGEFKINAFNTTGPSVFILTADDGSNTANDTINQIFVSANITNNTLDLELEMVSLLISDILVPGEFSFDIIIKNETLASRQVKFKPFITCNGVRTSLDGGTEFLDTYALSSNAFEDEFRYMFKSNTNNYEAQIPTDSACRFTIIVVDKFGTNIEVTKAIEFKYPQAELKLQSIRGQGTDIMDYMNSIVTSSIKKGYNTIEFNLINNEFDTKEISITMLSRELGLNNHIEVKLGPGAEKAVQIPILINDKIKKGSYSIRIGVNDGANKQVRYALIRIS